MANIVGGVTSINNPRTNWAQTDAKKADYLKNKPSVANALKGHKTGAVISADDVSPVEHELDIKVSSKNILPNDYIGKTWDYTKTWDMKATSNDDGSISLSGTCTGGSAFIAVLGYKDYLVLTQDAVFSSYLTSGNSGNTYRIVLEVIQSTTGSTRHCDVYTLESTSLPLPIPKGSIVRRMYISVKDGVNVDGVTFYPQLEYGTVPTTEFTPPSMDVEGVNVTVTDGENSQTAVADADGNVKGLMSLAPSMTLTTDNAGAVIECTYNRDANKVVTDLETKLNTLIATIGG